MNYMKIKLLVNHSGYDSGEIVEAEQLELDCVKIKLKDSDEFNYLQPELFVFLPDEPELVCVCGRTSEGVCWRCGQNMV